MPVATPAAKPYEINPDLAGVLESVLGAAESAVGVGYRWGGNSLAAGVDCSGLIQQTFLAAGIRVPRVSADQARVGQSVASINEAQPGDILSWDNSGRNIGADHVAIYLGNGLMIEAYRTGAPVRVTEVRAGAKINRVIGVLDATTPGNVPLGPNQDRKFTAQALGVGPGVTADMKGVVQASAVVDAPEGGLGDDLPENATPEQTEEYIRERFPDLGLLMENDEIRYVLTWAVREDRADADIVGALRQTEYWRTHSETSREVDLFLAREGLDSAEVRRVTDDAKNIVSDLFSRNGIRLDDPTLSSLAMQALRNGDITLQGQVMDPAGLNSLLAFGLGQAVGDLPAGEASFTADSLMQMARSDYLLPVTQREADRWAVDILNGAATEQSVRAELNARARERYGWLGLSDGQMTSQKFDGAVAEVARLLEVDPDTIDLLDPQWNWIVEKTDDKGQRYSPPLGEVAQGARDKVMAMPFASRPTWAKEADSEITMQLARWAGRVQ